MSTKKPIPAQKKANKKSAVSKKMAPAAKKKPLAKISKKSPPAKKTPVKKPPAKKPPVKKAPAKKPPVKKTPAKKPAAPVKKPLPKAVKKPPAKISKKSAPAKKTPVKKSPAKKLTAKKTVAPAKKLKLKKPAPKKTPAKKITPAKKSEKKVKKSAGRKEKTPRVKEPRAKKSRRSAKQSGTPPPVPEEKTPPKPEPKPAIFWAFNDIEQFLKTHNLEDVKPYDPDEDVAKNAAAKGKNKAAKPEKEKTRDVEAVSLADIFGFNPFKKDDPANEENLIPQKWRKYYLKLVHIRSVVQEGLTFHTEDVIKKSGKDASGDLSGYGQHMADAGTDSFDRDFALGIASREQEALVEIADAIDRMKKGTYGICEQTGKPIPAERLKAVPFARYSLEGQRQIERDRRGNRRGVIGEPVVELGEGANFGTDPEEEEE